MEGKGRGSTTGVREFAPNALGLYDMSGNVFEWCWDWWSEGEDSFYRTSDGANDPAGPPESIDGTRVVRGGSWGTDTNSCRSGYRYRVHPIGRNIFIGFRVSRRL